MLDRDRISDDKCMDSVPSRFAAVAAARGDVLAVEGMDGTALTYDELSQGAEKMAQRLRAAGVGPEVVVGVALERSPDLIVSLLAVARAGGAYAPLDPAHPVERLRFMLEDSGARVLVIAAEHRADFAGFSGQILDPLDDAGEPEPSRRDLLAPEQAPPVHPDNLLCVIYTSGSTGRPKGVGVTHRGVCHLTGETPVGKPSSEDRLAQLANHSFDVATLEIWGTLLNGATLVMIAPEIVRSPPELKRELRERGVTRLTLTTALFHEASRSEPDTFEGTALLMGGETMDPEACRRVFEAGAPKFLVNGYGPTEGTVCVLWHRLRTAAEIDDGWRSVPIGDALPGTDFRIVGDAVADGGAGELLIGGPQLARGYLGRPALTASRWVPHPAARTPGRRLYRTGDLVSTLPSGLVEFVGRRDQQIKLSGFRIELGEIEAAAAEHPRVAQAVVEVRGESSGRRLVAYLVAAAGTEPLPAEELREFLARRLPEYMVPVVQIWLDRLPLTAHGKVDRAALPEPEGPATGERVAPRTDLEASLVELWRELLGMADLGIEDGLFELGGHSLLATRLATRIRHDLGVEVPLGVLFEHPTVAALAGWIEGRDSARETLFAVSQAPPLVAVPRGGDLPPSFAQQRVWFLQQLRPGILAYQLQAYLRLLGRLRARALERALQAVIRRHEAFRTTFVAREGRPVQVIHWDYEFHLPVVDLSGLPEEVRAGLARETFEGLYRRVIDPGRLPLVIWVLVRLSPQEQWLLHTEHHFIHDGWSFNILLEEIARLYRAEVLGEDAGLPELPVQFADFAVWQHRWAETEACERQVDYWRRQLASAPPILNLPLDRPRPTHQSFRGNNVRRELPPAAARALRALCRRQGATVFSALLSTFYSVMLRYTGQTDITVGSAIANRRWRETERLIGMMLNNVVLRGDLSGDPSFSELLGRIKKVTREAFDHQDAPFEKVVEAVRPQRSADHNPLFQVFFSFHDAPLAGFELPDLELDMMVALPNGSAKFDINVTVILPEEQRVGQAMGDESETVTFLWEYATDLFDETTIRRLARSYFHLLGSALASPEERLSRLSMTAAAERHQLLSEWNAAAADHGPPACLHELVERQVDRTPEATALEFEGRRLSYRQLDEAANRVARRLIRSGAGPERPVAISVERSFDLLAGLLGILKAGAAYLPLDPAYPAERLRLLLEDSAARWVLTHEATRERLQGVVADLGLEALHIDAEESGGGESGTRPGPIATPDNLAYVIYTSGSTGRPKGAMNAHRGIVNRLRWGQRAFPLGSEDRVLQKTPFSFDVSVWELFWPLTVGATLVVARPGGHREPAYLRELIEGAGLTTVHFVPSMLRSFLEGAFPGGAASPEASVKPARLGRLRRVMASGEALTPELVEAFSRHLDAELHNLYGPTEAAVEVTAWQCRVAEVPVPIGRPVENARIDVLDRRARPVPMGVAGELAIGGVPVARGYWRRPALTAERFVPDAQSGLPGRRSYRSGDLARHRSDGAVEFLGRLDYQVKVRGFRIELGEIEAVLGGHPGVRECAVLKDDLGDSLVAYVVPAGPSGDVDLRAELRKALPEHMVPTVFHELETLPLLTSGKVDRRALAALEVGSGGRRAEYLAPRNEIEELLRDIWAELIPLPRSAGAPTSAERIGVKDNFFDLGGHSLHATRHMYRVRELLEIELPVRTLYDAPTIEEMARVVEEVLVEEMAAAEQEAVGAPR